MKCQRETHKIQDEATGCLALRTKLLELVSGHRGPFAIYRHELETEGE